MKNHAKNLASQDAMIFGSSLNRLIALTEEPSVKMPSGLTREQRRAWAKQAIKEAAPFIA